MPTNTVVDDNVINLLNNINRTYSRNTFDFQGDNYY